MSVYMIVEIHVIEPQEYSQYVDGVRDIIERHGGRYLARGGKVVPLAGNWNPERIILIEFDNLHSVQTCLQSPEYRELAPLRENSTTSRAIIVEGCTAERSHSRNPGKEQVL